MKKHVLHSVHIDTFWGIAKKVIEGHIPIFDFLSVQYKITMKERVNLTTEKTGFSLVKV